MATPPVADLARDPPPGQALRITVLNGNLCWVRHPLLIGHYRSTRLTGTEAVVDRLLGGALSASLATFMYPEPPGTHQIFVNHRRDPGNPWRAPHPSAAIVVGLGAEGGLSGQALSLSVRQAVVAWVARLFENEGEMPASMELTSTLMGSGSVSISPGDAARAIALGVREANRHLARNASPIVSQLNLVELYLERASDAWFGVQVLAVSAPGDFAITPIISSGVGPLRSPLDIAYRGAEYDLMTVVCTVDDGISFALHTGRARTVVRALTTQGKLLRELIRRASTDTSQDPRLGHTLFQLLVPPEIEPFMAGSSRLLLELDDRTAGIPWELLDMRSPELPMADVRPWAIRTQLLRTLRHAGHRQQLSEQAIDEAVLVIGEPEVDALVYPPLPGARAEARAVVDVFTGSGGVRAECVNALVDGNDAATIVNSLFERHYRIMHVVGHGELGQRDAASGHILTSGGVVLSDGAILGPHEIGSMRSVPELVFVNCCHLAAHDAKPTPWRMNLTEFAWGLADALMEIGVRCVIATGWAVDDHPAEVFATTFYREILAGRTFVAAATAAREAAWQVDRLSYTWAAYQCYGDPNWQFRRTDHKERSRHQVNPSYDGITSPVQLRVALDELAVGSRFMSAELHAQIEKLRHLEDRFGSTWGHSGAVAEAFGLAWTEAGHRKAAISWYERAVQAQDRSASMKAPEQLVNLRIREAWAIAQTHAQDSATLDDARSAIRSGVHELTRLLALSPTIELTALCGSAWRRLGMLELQSGNAGAANLAFVQARDRYAQAQAVAMAAGDVDLFYPALNKLELDLILAFDEPAGASPVTLAHPVTKAVRRSLEQKLNEDPDFWSHGGDVEWTLLEAIARRTLTAELPQVLAAYAELHRHVASTALWAAAATPVLMVLRQYAVRASMAEAAAAKSLERLLMDYGGVSEAAVQTVADVLVWHGGQDRARAKALTAQLHRQGLASWLAAEATGHIDSAQDTELRYRMERAKACVLVFRRSAREPTRQAQHDWQQLLVAIERRNETNRVDRPTLMTWTAGEGDLPAFLQQSTQFRSPLHNENDVAAALSDALRPAPRPAPDHAVTSRPRRARGSRE